MGRTIRLFEGRFGRLMLMELGAREQVSAQKDPAIVLQQGADDDVVFLNPGEVHIAIDASRVVVFHAAGSWLRESFPAVFAETDRRPFLQRRETVTPRIRQLAETMAIEVLNDRFLSPERLEFMLQELLLSIAETYLAPRGTSALWQGSRFEDTRIRQAIAVLRANPNKDLNMDDLATRVGLSRSRFYDLFQVCTGFSPRAYLDMLCVETAISRLSSTRQKIADVAAELGFSAQSNFTRFFLNQVGVPPSKYRRAAAGQQADEPESDPGSRG